MTKEYMAETTIKSGVGLMGAVTSWNLAAFNQMASLSVAGLTAVYLVVQMHKALKK